MKLDEKYSYITVCPTTGEELSDNQRHNSGSVCPHCGHDNDGSFTHRKKVVGRWNRPSLLERLKSIKPEFLRKADEDEIMAKLKGKYKPAGYEDGINVDNTTKKQYVDQNMRQMKRVRGLLKG